MLVKNNGAIYFILTTNWRVINLILYVFKSEGLDGIPPLCRVIQLLEEGLHEQGFVSSPRALRFNKPSWQVMAIAAPTPAGVTALSLYSGQRGAIPLGFTAI